MIYTVEELNRISGSRLAVNGRIYLDNKGNKYKGTVNGRIEQINISDRNVNIKLEVDDTPQSLKNFLVNLKNFTESSIELLKNLLSNKQDRLISGENIKTINNESLLGSGNIIISGSSYDGDPTIIDQDSNHRFVTDTEKSTWNSKANGTHTHAISDVTNLQTSLDGKANTSHTHSISDVSGLQTALDGKQASGSYANASHTHSISDVTNLQTSLDGKASTLHTHAISDVTNLQTTLDGKASSSHTHTASNITDFNSSVDARIALQQDESAVLAYKALGSNIKAETVNFPLVICNTSSNLTDNQIRWTAVYLKEADTLTGARVYMRVQGAYTGDNTNGAALYTYSGGTLTQVAVSANTSNLWTAAANGRLNIPFTSTYSASAGLYFVAILYNQATQTTAPAVATGTALNNAAMGGTAYEFTNSAKLYGTSNSNTLPASIAMSSITASTAPTWVALY